MLDKNLWHKEWFIALTSDQKVVFLYLLHHAELPDKKTFVPWFDLCEAVNISPTEAAYLIKQLHFEYAINSNIPDLKTSHVAYTIPYARFTKIDGAAPKFERVLLSTETRNYIHALDNFTCVYCGAPSEEIDHVQAVSRGGTNEIQNLVAACLACNRTKSDRTLFELGWSFIKDSRPARVMEAMSIRGQQ